MSKDEDPILKTLTTLLRLTLIVAIIISTVQLCSVSGYLERITESVERDEIIQRQQISKYREER